MEIFTEIYYFRLNAIQDRNTVRNTKCCTGQYFIQFYREQIEFITKICVC